MMKYSELSNFSIQGHQQVKNKKQNHFYFEISQHVHGFAQKCVPMSLCIPRTRILVIHIHAYIHVPLFMNCNYVDVIHQHPEVKILICQDVDIPISLSCASC